jgi:hypothetical protein
VRELGGSPPPPNGPALRGSPSHGSEGSGGSTGGAAAGSGGAGGDQLRTADSSASGRAAAASVVRAYIHSPTPVQRAQPPQPRTPVWKPGFRHTHAGPIGFGPVPPSPLNRCAANRERQPIDDSGGGGGGGGEKGAKKGVVRYASGTVSSSGGGIGASRRGPSSKRQTSRQVAELAERSSPSALKPKGV